MEGESSYICGEFKKALKYIYEHINDYFINLWNKEPMEEIIETSELQDQFTDHMNRIFDGFLNISEDFRTGYIPTNTIIKIMNRAILKDQKNTEAQKQTDGFNVLILKLRSALISLSIVKENQLYITEIRTEFLKSRYLYLKEVQKK